MSTRLTHDFDAATGAYTGKAPRPTNLKPEAKPTGSHDFDAATGRYTGKPAAAPKNAA